MIIEFLNQELSQRNKKNPAYSLRAFAKSVGVNSGALSALLNKKRPLTVATAKKILSSLDLDSKTRKMLLQSLVFKNENEKSVAYHDLSEDIFQIVQNWENYAILSALEVKKADNSLKAISQRLKISQATAQSALESLKRVGLVTVVGDRITATYKNLASSNEIPSAAIKLAHKQYIQKALDAIDRQSIDDRDFSGMTMAISKKKLPQAKNLIKQFRRELCQLLENGDRDEVYRLNIQLFSLENKKEQL